MPKKSKKTPITKVETVYLSRGLQGQDDNIDTLLRLWEELQLSSVDAAKVADVDLIAFAHECFYFGVVSCKNDAYNPHIRPVIGLVCLIASPSTTPLDVNGELSLDIILDSPYRGHGLARKLVDRVLRFAFDEAHTHRVQALLMDGPSKDTALTLFTQSKFTHEGTSRSSFFSPFDQSWKDVTCLAILDTDWVMQSYHESAPKSMWDALFARHAKEREELLRWEDEQTASKHAASMETIRIQPSTATEGSVAWSDDSSSIYRSPKGKGKRVLYRLDGYDASESEMSSYDDGPSTMWTSDSEKPFEQYPPSVDTHSPQTVPRSATPDSLVGSQWDMLDISSTSGHDSSEFELI